MRYVCEILSRSVTIILLSVSLSARAEFGVPLRPKTFNGHVVYRAVAAQPGNTSNFLAVGRAWAGSSYYGIISSQLTDGGWKNGSFTKTNNAWYPGQKMIDFGGAGFDNLCNAVTYAYDGFIVACRSMKSNGYYDIYLAKVSADGTLDTAFGTAGIVTTGIGGNSTNGHGFVRGIAYNSEVNTSDNGLITIVGTVGTNSSNYRPFIASFNQETGAQWGTTLKLTDYVGTAVGVIYDSTTSDAYYVAATETLAPHNFYVHKLYYDNSADTSLSESSSPWGDAIDFTDAGGGTESIPSGITLGSTGAWGVDILVVGSNRPSAGTGHWVCATAALRSDNGNLRTSYGDTNISGGTDLQGLSLLTHDSSNDCILNNVVAIGSGVSIAIGTAYTTSNGNYDQLAIKLDANGSLVTGFGSSGFKILASGSADDVHNSAALIGSYIYTGGRVHDSSLYQGGDIQRFSTSTGAAAPIVQSIEASLSSQTAGQAVGITVVATLSDGSTTTIPLSSLNLSSSDATKLAISGSSPVLFSGTSGSVNLGVSLTPDLETTAPVTIETPSFVTTNLVGDWDAAYANFTGPHTSSNATWYDLSPNEYDGTSNNTSHATWTGSGTYSSPYTLSLNGSGYVDFGTSPLTSAAKVMYSAWVKSSDVASSSEAVILGNSTNAAGNGFTVRQLPSYRDVVMSLSPRAYWRFNEKSGTTADEISGYLNGGSYNNGVTLNASGALYGDPDTAAWFDGTNDYIPTNLDPTTELGQTFTITAWVYPTSCSNYRGIAGAHTGAYAGVIFGQCEGGNWVFAFGNGSNWVGGITATPVLNAWTHIAVVYKGSNYVIYYRNGQRIATTTVATNINHYAQFWIGRAYDSTDRYFSGMIDDVAVFTTELTSAQIGQLYTAGVRGKVVETVVGKDYETVVKADSPVGYWRLGETSGTAARDSSGNGYGLLYTNSPTLGATGALSSDGDKAASFDGSNDYAYASSPALNLSNTFSIELWFKASNKAKDHLIVCWGQEATGKRRGIFAASTSGYFGFTGYAANITSTTDIVDGSWHHLVATVDASNGVKLYVDGTQVASGTPSLVSYSYANTYLGSNNSASENAQATMDEVAIYNTVLTSTQVSTHRSAGLGTYGGICRTTSTLGENVWTNLSAIANGAGLYTYVNGMLECNATVANGLTSPNSGLYLGATSSNTKNFTGSIAELKLYGSDSGTVIATGQEVKTNFDATSDVFRAKSNGGMIRDGLMVFLDAANAKSGVRPYDNGCDWSAATWFDLGRAGDYSTPASGLSGTLTNFASCGASSGWNGDGTATISSTAGPYRLTFDGTNDYVTIPDTNNIMDFGSSAFSYGWWEYRTSNSNGKAAISREASSDGYTPYIWGYSNGGANLLVYGTSAGTSWDIANAKSLGPVTLNRWAQYFLTRSGSTFTTYKNGVQQDQWTNGSAFKASSSSAMIGGNYLSTYYFSGHQDAITVYNTALSQADIRQNFDAHAPRFRATSPGNIVTDGLVLNLDAANATGVAAYSAGCASTDNLWWDLSSSANIGTMNNFSSCSSSTGWNGDGTTTVSGTNGPYRLTFDGSNDFISVPTSSAISPASGVTVEAWVYPTNLVHYQHIVCKHSASTWSGDYADYCLRFVGDKVEFWVRLAQSGVLTGVTSVSAGAWSHIVGTYDGASRKIYINGALDTSDTVTGTILTSGYPLAIGSQATGGAAGSLLTGSLGEVNVYNRGLAQWEILQNCNALKSRFNGATCN